MATNEINRTAKAKGPKGRPDANGNIPDGFYFHKNHGVLPEAVKYFEFDTDAVPGYPGEKEWKPTKNTRAVLISMSNVYNLGARWIQATAMHAGYDAHTIFFGRLLANDYTPPTEVDWQNFEKALKEINPHVIGLSIACTSYYKLALQVDEFVKKVLPNAIVIWGSIHVNVSPDQCFKHNDILCLGEGELPFIELLDRVENNQPYHDIPNLWVRTKDGKEYKNHHRPVIRDLDSVPFPIWDDKNKWYIRKEELGRNQDPAFKEYYIFVMTNRGCPFRCNFCINSLYNEGDFKDSGHNKTRQRSVGHVVAELESMREKYWNFDNLQISFFDDVFTLNGDWVIDFAAEYKKKFKNPFWCYFHPSCVREDLMDALKDIGLSHIDIGIQSGSQRVRMNLMKRPETDAVIRKSCDIMKERGISVVIDCITDNPFETRKDLNDGLEFFLSLPGPYSFNFYSLIYFPGVQFTQFAMDAGYIDRDDVEDVAGKTLDQFVATFDYKDRKPMYKKYIPLFHMAARRVFTKNFILWLASKDLFEDQPWMLYRLVDLQNVLDVLRKMTKIPAKMREGWTWNRFYARMKLYLLWERPYNK